MDEELAGNSRRCFGSWHRCPYKKMKTQMITTKLVCFTNPCEKVLCRDLKATITYLMERRRNRRISKQYKFILDIKRRLGDNKDSTVCCFWTSILYTIRDLRFIARVLLFVVWFIFNYLTLYTMYEKLKLLLHRPKWNF